MDSQGWKPFHGHSSITPWRWSSCWLIYYRYWRVLSNRGQFWWTLSPECSISSSRTSQCGLKLSEPWYSISSTSESLSQLQTQPYRTIGVYCTAWLVNSYIRRLFYKAQTLSWIIRCLTLIWKRSLPLRSIGSISRKLHVISVKAIHPLLDCTREIKNSSKRTSLSYNHPSIRIKVLSKLKLTQHRWNAPASAL